MQSSDIQCAPNFFPSDQYWQNQDQNQIPQGSQQHNRYPIEQQRQHNDSFDTYQTHNPYQQPHYTPYHQPTLYNTTPPHLINYLKQFLHKQKRHRIHKKILFTPTTILHEYTPTHIKNAHHIYLKDINQSK